MGRSAAARWAGGRSDPVPRAAARIGGKQHAGKPHGGGHGCARIDKRLPTYSDWPRVHSRIESSKKLEARVKSMVSKLTPGGEDRPDDAAGDRRHHPGRGPAVPHRLRAQRRRLVARREQARHAGRLARSWPTRTGRPPRPATPLGVPAIWGIDAVHGNSNVFGATLFPHNIGLGAAHDPCLVRDVAGRHGPRRARHRPGLGVRADARRRPRRPLGPHLRGLLRGPADHARLRLRGDEGPAGRRPRRHRLERRDRHRQALHRRRRHRGRQGPGRQPVVRAGDDQHPRPGLLRRAGRRLPERDDLVQLVDQRGARDRRGQAPRQPQGDHGDPQGQDGLRRPRRLRLERHRPGHGLHERELPAGHQRRHGRRDGAERLEGVHHQHRRAGRGGRDPDVADRRRGDAHPAREAAHRPAGPAQAVEAPLRA